MKLKQDIQTSMLKTDTHMYLLPHPLLRPYIAHYTICHRSYQKREPLYLVPDVSGCIVISVLSDGGLTIEYWGPTTRMVTVWKEPGEDRVQYFVEFHPSGSHAFFATAQHLYRDERIALKQLHANCCERIETAYYSAFKETMFFHQLDEIFLSMLHTEDGAMKQLLQGLQRNERIADVMDSFGYSRRQLQRMVQTRLGCSMKTIQKIQRINQAVTVLKEQQHSLTMIAHLCGFYDQAHFIHDFREICQVTPQQYQRRLHEFYNEDFKF